MSPCRSLTRRAILQLLAGSSLTPMLQADSSANLMLAVEQGFQRLDARYWSPELTIWLDRPGNDLRAWFEGRLNPPWWSCANAVETLADFMAATGNRRWVTPLAELHRRHRDNPDHVAEIIPALKARGQWSAPDDEARRTKPRPRHSTKAGFRDFNNEYLDDSGWWGLAWLQMHHLTGGADYLATARAIQRHMDAHRLPDGGIIWNLEQQPPVTNAISNSLFLTLSARLHTFTGETAYLAAARKTRQWFDDQKLFDGTGIVDGPGHQGDYWSYNQGMWILSLLALAEAAREPARVDEAAAFTRTLLEKAGFVQDGVLIEKLSQTGWDTALFKGVLARALGQLRDTLNRLQKHPDVSRQVTALLQASAASLQQHSVGPTGEFGLQWQPGAKNQEWNFNTQLAALMALTAILPVPLTCK